MKILMLTMLLPSAFATHHFLHFPHFRTSASETWPQTTSSFLTRKLNSSATPDLQERFHKSSWMLWLTEKKSDAFENHAIPTSLQLQTPSETVFGVDFWDLKTFSEGIWSTRAWSRTIKLNHGMVDTCLTIVGALILWYFSYHRNYQSCNFGVYHFYRKTTG